MMEKEQFLLQSILLETRERPEGSAPLYWRGDGVKIRQDGAEMAAGGTLDLFTYFNLFNHRKWHKYARVENVRLLLSIYGSFRIKIFAQQNGSSKTLVDSFTHAAGRLAIDIPHDEPGIYSVELRAISPVRILGGGWYTVAPPSLLRTIKPAVIICTYKREEYVKKNLEILRVALPAEWGCFVVDNGQTLDAEKINSPDGRFKLVPNPNTGGSGGFTRGIVEAFRDSGEWTHVVLMDDDVIIEPESIRRTDMLLRLLNPQYDKHFIGGAMLRMDACTVQQEAGATWNGIFVKQKKHQLDLAHREELLENEEEVLNSNLYAGWWYCALPLGNAIEEDLPLPLFLRYDDIEYSLRRAGGIIYLNGVGVWHEPFLAKENPARRYFLSTRNALILNSRHFTIMSSLCFVVSRLLFRGLRLDGEGVRHILNGVEEFLAGPFAVVDAYSQISQRVIKAEPPEKQAILPRIISLGRRLIREYPVRSREFKEMRLNLEMWDTINAPELAGQGAEHVE